jgi:hypothetical protein
MRERKSTNPKDMASATTKLPLHLFPATAVAAGSVKLFAGMLKYGLGNWRHDGARASVYVGAALRHIQDYQEGHDLDTDGECNLAGALASIAILIDSRAAGVLVDDRNYLSGYRALVAELTPKIAEMVERYGDLKPKHYTIQDGG